MISHIFRGKWITNREFESLVPKNMFHRQLEGTNRSGEEHRDSHVLFRKTFTLSSPCQSAFAYVTADDYYKLYINGRFVAQGPTPGYPFAYNYNTINVTDFLHEGENCIAVHTLYQGLTNRVWMSGDNRHGLLLDLVVDGSCVVYSDESFLTAVHTAYTPIGIIGYDTQFAEEYDSADIAVGFEFPNYDDSGWESARLRKHVDYTLVPQATAMLDFESIQPISIEQKGNTVFLDFGATYVGYLCLRAKGRKGDRVEILCGQELNDDQSVRYEMRCNCVYRETWLLSGGDDRRDAFDYQSFRYAELHLPNECQLIEAYLFARHYPFTLSAKPRYDDPMVRPVWDLCVHSIRYGVQEVIQDCMDREKGFYVGDGCYTALTQMILSGDDSMVRYLIDSARHSTRFVESTVTCLNCSFMQEIAEYPLILIFLMLWHYRLTGDLVYLEENYRFAVSVLDCYRKDYETDGLLQNLDKWCVVEWPKNFQDDYDVDICEGKICVEPHMVMNAYYLKAIETVNIMASILGNEFYRDITAMRQTFYRAFYDPERCVFTDSPDSVHSSLMSNAYGFGFGLAPDRQAEDHLLALIRERGFERLHSFSTFPVMMRLAVRGDYDILRELLGHEGMWRRMISEGATTTFESWCKDGKWNTSLFHLTFSSAAIFIADIDHKTLFES